MFESHFVTLSIQHGNEMTDKVRDKVDIIVGDKLGNQANTVRHAVGDKLGDTQGTRRGKRRSETQLQTSWETSLKTQQQTRFRGSRWETRETSGEIEWKMILENKFQDSRNPVHTYKKREEREIPRCKR